MVTTKKSLLLLSLSLIVVLGPINAEAQSLIYHVNHEWVKIWINQDGTIDVLYDIEVACDQGTLHWFEIGQPNDDFIIGDAFDESGTRLPTSDESSRGDYRVRVDVEDIDAGESTRFTLTTNVGRMVWEDVENPGNVGMKFTPSWFSVNVGNLRVRIVMPEGVTEVDVKTLTGVEWDNADYVDGPFAVYWEREDLSPNVKFTFGVSFPEQYVEHYEVQPDFIGKYGLWIGVFIVLVLILVGVVLASFQKKPYLKPVMSMEALGVRRGLTAVEAACLLDLKPEMIVTTILYSLLKKRAVWVTATEPSVRLRVIEKFKETPQSSTVNPLRYYEIDFLKAVKKDGTLDEQLLAETISFLDRSVEEKLHGYCRKDTVDYYSRVVEKVWTEVAQAETSKLSSELFDEHLLWLLLDPNRQKKTEKAFSNRVFEPSSLWFWYWFGYRHYHPRPEFEPNVDTPAKSGQPPKIPGAEFANNIATAVEKTSNNIVNNLEKFANAILPASPPPKTSRQPTHHRSNCVCACAACACACACVSCACACAGGGAG
ncbi:MAG: hypothetical protein JSV35_03530 [Candidatus Bathyarchaeota archaeon]|nr:MAG: hypothetical protein JSV35_03530 [Candidatus Bathyarchaeota archaeon]